ncbi:MAG: SAM-dependent methyltransferase [Chitinophagaceae bacterium]
MKANTASKTAQYMALFRALETKRAKHKRLFTDPYAIHFLDAGLRTISKLSAIPIAARGIGKIIQHKIPGAYTSGLARTKLIDNLLQQSISNGAKQLIILGAGFDTRALRLDFLRNFPVIEIDHPDTAALKIKTLKKINKQLPGNVRYLQIDFNKQSLQHLLEQHNIDFSVTTTIIWEGVTNYLDKKAIDATFTTLQQFPKNSSVIFTYVDSEVFSNPERFFGAEKLLNDLKAIEERWTFGFEPKLLAVYLQQYQFQLLTDEGAAAYRQHFVPERNQLNKGYEFYRVAFAQKK